MKIATLAIIVKGNKVLLGYKKKGEIGTNTLNGPGGKCEPNESPINCLIRETKEELDITLDAKYLEKISVITFFFAGVASFEVHVFRTDRFEGTPKETADMIPDWYDVNNLPLDKMLESDREWFSKAIRGEKFNANVYYRARASNFEKIEFLPT
ncbi:MAG: 8-oxo-dGTP diphosphatase [Patescibacteria group bacterium]